MSIEYKINKNNISVKLSGMVVGHIKPVLGGYQYFPKGSKTGGEIYKTIEKVKKTL
jgi:hypothetical protein